VRKRCGKCGQEKSLDHFCRNRNSRDGRNYRCKICHNAAVRETVKRLYGNSRHYHLKQRFGIGAAEVDEMIKAQGGLCPICQVRAAVHVDHDHKTGKVRAILCEPCNGGLGQFRDNPETIRRAIEYLADPPARKVLK
jgi:hypothetical protein